MTIDGLKDFRFGGATKEWADIFEHGVQFGQCFGDQGEQRRGIRDENEAVPEIVAIVQLERDLARGFLEEPANPADLAGAGSG